MKKDFFFVLLIVGIVFAVSVYAWPTYYEGQLINSQGYQKSAGINATWNPTAIVPTYTWQPTYKDGTWIGGYGMTYITYSLTTNTIMFAAYGCCNDNTNSSWYLQYPCNFTDTRYRVQNYGEWRCGWNIAFGEPSNQTQRCTDSDGGYNLEEFGIVNVQYSSGYGIELPDICNNFYYITEYWCLENITAQSNNTDCRSLGLEYSCSNGACVVNQTGNYTWNNTG